MSMKRFVPLMLAAIVGGTMLVTGCTKKPSQDELTRLEEAKAAAESAEHKLDELRQERVSLEQQLSQKEGELKTNEQERDNLKNSGK